MNDEILREMDRLLREDLEVGRNMLAINDAKNARIRYLAQRMREAAKPFDKQYNPLAERRKELRAKVLELWAKAFDNRTSLDLPLGKVCRRNYRELTVKDKSALLAALDRLDQLRLVDYVFDQKGVFKLLDRGKLDVSEGTIEVADNFNVQVFPKEDEADVPDQPEEAR